MKSLEKTGINPKWLKDRKRIANNGRDWIDTHDLDNQREMQAYIAAGVIPELSPEFGPEPVVHPPFQRWERRVNNWLSMYGAMRLFEMESVGLEGARFDLDLARRAFTANYFHELISLNRQYLFPKRFDGRFLGGEALHGVSYAALGMVIGCAEQAGTIPRLLLNLTRHPGYLSGLYDFPSRLFMLRLFADHLGETQLSVEGRALGYPTYMQLIDVWKTPDPQAIVPLCLAVCDLHTHHAYKQPDGFPGDFDNLKWTYTPIEILLLFKLRQLRGLENPALDHPLMNTVLGKLPEETVFAPDELVQGVLVRMRSEGFDEAVIVKRILGDEYHLVDGKEKSARGGEESGLRPFLSPGFGVLLHAPETWQETSTERYFQVIDPETGTQFTASAYENPGITLEQWAEARLGMLAQGMPFMKVLGVPYGVDGIGWHGIAAECRGTFPQDDKESHYLVLCLHTEKRLISFTVTARTDIFAKNEPLYRELLTHQLRLVPMQELA